MSCKDSREMWMKQKDEPIRVAQIMGKLWAGGVEMVVFNYYRAIDRKQNGGLAGSGTQGSRPVPLDTLSRSKASKMRLHSTRPHKRIKRGIYLY